MNDEAADPRVILGRLISICSAGADPEDADLAALRFLKESGFDWMTDLKRELDGAKSDFASLENEVKSLEGRDLLNEWRATVSVYRRGTRHSGLMPTEVAEWVSKVDDLKKRVLDCQRRRKLAARNYEIGSQLESRLLELADAAKKKRQALIEEQERRLEAQRQSDLRNKVVFLLQSGAWKEADDLYATQCQSWWPQIEFEQTRKEQLFASETCKTYSKGTLRSLDELFASRDPAIQLTSEDWSSVKNSKVQARLRSMGFGPMDTQQLLAIGRPDQRLLIQARAGSGKTRTICARAALAIRDEGLSPDQVLILAFNKSAADEVKHRVRTMGRIETYENARTFHSLAYQLAKPSRRLLFDDGGHPNAREQSRFVQRLLQRVMNPAFKESMVEFFRKELEQIEKIGRDLSPSDYLIFRRSLEQITLSGQRVKSTGEKFIADFLFEHDIQFRYERTWEWKTEFLHGTAYRPDFSILSAGKDFILEHWAIDPKDPGAEVPSHWDTTTDEYRKQIEAKRHFWRENDIPLIETHSGQTRNRENFEKELERALQLVGIRSERLSKEEIIRRVFENDFTISRMAELFLQFIQRAKKRAWSPDQLSQRFAVSPDSQPRARLFHELALRVYREYEAQLHEEGAMDFDDLLLAATNEVELRGAEATIHLGEGRIIPLGDIRWLLLDEFQDFSDLYFKMLSAILEATPHARLVAVGDDWQAINGFAGAELRFFQGFESYFPGAQTAGITTNYRSDKAIVEAGNKLMQGRGQIAQSSRMQDGLIDMRYVDKVWIEFRGGNDYQSARESDSIYLDGGEKGQTPSNRDLRLAKAMKCCVEIMSESPTVPTILLARTNSAYGVDLLDFQQKLVKALSAKTEVPPSKIHEHLSTSTAHRSKGQEAERVIILDATAKQFPKVHPDNLLFEPFGITPEEVLEEERRLFYVAITRAEHELYLLTESEQESPFIEDAALAGQSPAAEPAPKHTPILHGGFAEKLCAQIEELGALPVDSGPWAEARFRASTTITALVLDLEAAGIPAPVVGFEWPYGGLNTDAELAWPNAVPPVAVLVGDQFRFRDQWLNRGWKVPPQELAYDQVAYGVIHYVRSD